MFYIFNFAATVQWIVLHLFLNSFVMSRLYQKKGNDRDASTYIHCRAGLPGCCLGISFLVRLSI